MELRTRPKSEYFRKQISSHQQPQSSSHVPNRPLSCDQSSMKPAAAAGNKVAPAGPGEEAASWSEGQLIMDMYVLGGREVGQVTVFKRPLSVWKLDLTSIS